MKFSQSQAEAHPVLAAPKPVRRKEVTRAVIVAALVFAVLALVTAAVLVDSFGGRLLFQR